MTPPRSYGREFARSFWLPAGRTYMVLLVLALFLPAGLVCLFVGPSKPGAAVLIAIGSVSGVVLRVLLRRQLSSR